MTNELASAILSLPIYEARALRDCLGVVPAFPPGSSELAEAIREAVAGMVADDSARKQCGALWLCEHGLCTWGQSLTETLSLTEEFEHLARIALLSGVPTTPVEAS